MKGFLSFLGQASILLLGLFLMTRIFPDSYGEIIESYAFFILPEFACIMYFADKKASLHEILPILGIALFLNAALLLLLFATVPSSYNHRLETLLFFFLFFFFPLWYILFTLYGKAKKIRCNLSAR